MRESIQLKASEESEVDMTPLLDVVFIILIFFVVTSSFVRERGVDVFVPQGGGLSKGISIMLEINELNEIRIQDRVVDVRAIKPTVIRLIAENPESTISVRLNPMAKTKTVISAIDGVRAANYPLPSVSLTSG